MNSWKTFFIGVISTIAFLAVVGGALYYIAVSDVDRLSDKKQTQLHMDLLRSALSLYFEDCKHFPTSLESLTSANNDCKNWGPEPYLKKSLKDGFGNEFSYVALSSSYRLVSLGKDMKEGGAGPDEDILINETVLPSKEVQVDIPFTRKIALKSKDCEVNHEDLRQAYRDFYQSARKKILQICNDDIERFMFSRNDQLKLNISCNDRYLNLTGNYNYKCEIPELKNTFSKLNLQSVRSIGNNCDLTYKDFSSELVKPNVIDEAEEKCPKGYSEEKSSLKYRCASGKLSGIVNSDVLCLN